MLPRKVQRRVSVCFSLCLLFLLLFRTLCRLPRAKRLGGTPRPTAQRGGMPHQSMLNYTKIPAVRVEEMLNAINSGLSVMRRVKTAFDGHIPAILCNA